MDPGTADLQQFNDGNDLSLLYCHYSILALVYHRSELKTVDASRDVSPDIRVVKKTSVNCEPQ